MASAVLLEPAPAITGTRPAATSTQTFTTSRCSRWESVGDSPVVPTGTSPFVPSAICHSTNARKAFSSKRPSEVNGVTSAVKEPLNMTSNLLIPLADIWAPAHGRTDAPARPAARAV